MVLQSKENLQVLLQNKHAKSLDIVNEDHENSEDLTLNLVADYAECYVLPTFLNQPAQMFYHQQLWVYNFGIFTPHRHFDCLYYETTAGRGSNEVLLNPDNGLLRKFGPKTLFFVADGCAGQCKNQYLIHFFH